MANARVGEQPLDIPLGECDRVADDHRSDGEPPERRMPRGGADGNASSQTRKNAANAAAFTVAAMYAVIGDGAPS